MTHSDDDRKREVRQLLQDYEEVFRTPNGERVLKDLRARLGVEETTEPTPFQAGKKAAYWEIEERLRFAEMVKNGMEIYIKREPDYA